MKINCHKLVTAIFVTNSKIDTVFRRGNVGDKKACSFVNNWAFTQSRVRIFTNQSLLDISFPWAPICKFSNFSRFILWKISFSWLINQMLLTKYSCESKPLFHNRDQIRRSIFLWLGKEFFNSDENFNLFSSNLRSGSKIQLVSLTVSDCESKSFSQYR